MGQPRTPSGRPDPVSKPARLLRRTTRLLASSEGKLPPLLRLALPHAVFLAAFAMLLPGLTHPSILMFDEQHYAAAAIAFDRGVLLIPDDILPVNYEHPPLGKLLMTMSYRLAGRPHAEIDRELHGQLCTTDDPACGPDLRAWRAPSAVVGALGIVGIYWLGLRLFGQVRAGLAAAAFLLSDPLYFLQSRVAMLDIYPVGFGLLALGMVLGASRAQRVAASILMGLALSGKYTAVFLWPMFMALAYHRYPGLAPRQRVRRVAALAFAIPGLVYVAAYAPFVVAAAAQSGLSAPLRMFVSAHWLAVAYDYGGAGTPGSHAYMSPPWTWPLVQSPVTYYFSGGRRDGVFLGSSVFALGNPLIWWTGCVLVLRTLLRYLRLTLGSQRTPGGSLLGAAAQNASPGGPMGAAPLVGFAFLAAYLPFFALARGQFLYYFLVAAPFLSLALAGTTAAWWGRGTRFRLAALAILVGAWIVFRFYLPVVTGEPIPRAQFDRITGAIPWMRLPVK